jgi:hypothetical protein
VKLSLQTGSEVVETDDQKSAEDDDHRHQNGARDEDSRGIQNGGGDHELTM